MSDWSAIQNSLGRHSHSSTQILDADTGEEWNPGSGNAYSPGGTDVPIADGGTGASTAAGARTNLGLGTAATHATGDYDAAGAAAAAQAASQPLDSDLTSIAALTTTSYGRAFLALADAAALRTAGGVVIGTDVQGFDSDIPTVSASQGEMTTGTETALRSMSPLRVAQAVAALAPSGGRNYIDSITLDGTYGTEFAEASLPAGRTRPSGLVVGDETYQSADGSYLRVALASTGGAADKAYYISSAPAGDCSIILSVSYFSASGSDMVGPGIADSSGNGVAAIIYQGSIRTIAIAGGHYSSLQGTVGIPFTPAGQRVDFKLRRSTNDWYASLSLDGYNFGPETSVYTVACTAARVYFGCYWATEAGYMSLGRLNKI